MMKRFIPVVCVLLFATTLWGQSFPVQVTPQVNPPHPVYLADYANTSTTVDRVQLQLLLTDLTVPSREVRLQLSIEGQGLNAQSNALVIGAAPIFLEGGVPLLLNNIELAPYFELQNLQGINPNVYGEALPEGSYRFCFQVIDVLSGNIISQRSCAQFIIFQNQPPLLTLPQRDTNIVEVNPQNIVFQWTPRHVNVSNVQYEFSLVEIWDEYIDPQTAFFATPPFYQTVTTQTSLIYGPAFPQLITGRRYAWQVRAFAQQGAEEIGVFTNNGESEVFWFSYQSQCNAPQFPTTEEVGYRHAKINWQGDLDHLDYSLQYREKNANSSWYTLETPRDFATIDNLKAETTYEYKVRGNCDFGAFGETQILEFTTKSEDAASYIGCNIEPEDVDLSNQEILDQLFVNDVFKAGDFPITVLQVTNGNAPFSGGGYVIVPWLGDTKIAVEFNNVQINTDMQLLSGEVVTTYDADWGNVDFLDELEEIIEDDNDDEDVELDFDIDIDDIEVNEDGDIVISDPDSDVEIVIPGDDDVTIIDSDGDVFHVDEDGNITEGGDIADGGPIDTAGGPGFDGGQLTQLSAQGIKVIFKDDNNYTYGFDQIPENQRSQLRQYYKSVEDQNGDTYDIIHKAVKNGGEEALKADIQVTDRSKLARLEFKNDKGVSIPHTFNTDSTRVTLDVKGHFSFENETIYAAIRAQGNEAQTIAGAFQLWHLSEDAVNLTIVAVNNASIPGSLETRLNTIFGKAVVNFQVSQTSFNLDPALYGGDTIQVGDSGLLTNYTSEERAIINAFKNQEYDVNQYYLFVFGEDVQPDRSIAGFMPLKRQFGFIFSNPQASEEGKDDMVQVMAHELGHGVFGLEHPFSQLGTVQGSTDWLMDYAGGSKLNHIDWAQIHNPDLRLYLFQDDEEGEFASLLLFSTAFTAAAGEVFSSPTFPDCYNFFMHNNQTVVTFSDQQSAMITSYTVTGNQMLKEIEVGQNSSNKMPGTYKPSLGCNIDTNTDTCISTAPKLRYVCFDCIDEEIAAGRETTITTRINAEGTKLYQNVSASSKYVITPTKVDCDNPVNVVRGFDSTNTAICESFSCNYEEDILCPQMTHNLTVDSDIIGKVGTGLEAAINSIDTSKANRTRPLGQFNHIFSIDGGEIVNISNDEKQWEILEDKFHLLSHYRQDTYFVLGLLRSANNRLYRPSQLNEIAEKAILAKASDKNVVLVLVNGSVFESIFGETGNICTEMGFAESNSDLTSADFIKKTGNQLTDLLSIYASVEKPLILNKYYQYANGTLQNYVYRSNSNLRGYHFIKHLSFFQSKAFKEAEQMRGNCWSTLNNCAQGCGYGNASCAIECSDDYGDCRDAIKTHLENGFSQEIAEGGLANAALWEEASINRLGRFREVYMDFDGSQGTDDSAIQINAGANYTLSLWKESVDSWAWWSKVEIATGLGTELTDNLFYDFDRMAIVDDVVYGVIDVAGLIPGVDTFADPIGAIYAGVRGDATNVAIYTASFAVPFAGAAYIKGGIEAGRRVDDLYGIVAKANPNAENGFDLVRKQLSDIQPDEFHIASSLHSGESKLVNKLDLNDVEEGLDVAFVQRQLDELGGALSGLEDWIRNLPNLSQAESTILLENLDSSPALMRLFVDASDDVIRREKLADSWKTIRDNISNQSGNTTQFALDPNTVNKVADYLDTDKLEAIGGKTELDSFIARHADVPCDTCGSGGLPVFGTRTMDEMIENYVEIGYAFRDHPELWAKLKIGTESANAAMREGTQHTLKVFKDNPTKYAPNRIDDLDMRFESVLDDICDNCRYDVKFKTDAPRYAEFKSYNPTTWANIKNSDKFIKQFKRYLQDVNSLDELTYVINGSKTSVDAVKDAFRELLEKEADNLFKPVNEQGLGIDKIKSLFGNDIDDVEDFLDVIDVMSGDDSIYKFIITN